MKKRFFSTLKENKFIFIAIFIVAFIPSLYTNLFLGSMWKPYKNVENLPVAVVNDDVGANIENKEINIGKDFVDKLKENKDLNFNFLKDKDEAEEKLRNGEYYMVIELNKDFSKNASTILKKDPKQMEFKYLVNPGINYISSKISDSSITKMEKELVKTIQKTYLETIFLNLEQSKDKMNQLKTAIEELKNGSVKINDAQSSILDGTKKLSYNFGVFDQGVKTFNDSISKYVKGVSTVHEGAKKLDSNSVNISNGFSMLNSNVDKGMDSISGGILSLKEGVSNLKNKLPNEDKIQKINDAIDNFSLSLNKISQGSNSLLEANKKIENSVSTLKNGVSNFSNNIGSTKQKINQAAEELLSYVPVEKRQEAAEKFKNKMKEANVEGLNDLASLLSSSLDKIDMGIKSVIGDKDNGLTKLESSNLLLAKNFDEFSKNQKLLNLGYINLKTNIEGTKNSSGIINSLDNIYNGITYFKDNLNAGKYKFENGLKDYLYGVHTLYEGTKKIDENSPKLEEGSLKIAQGGEKLRVGMDKLESGVKEISSGTSKLKDGSIEILDKMNKESDKMVDNIFEEKNSDTLSSPIKIERKEVSKVENNGHAMAPYMITISLFVGSLAFCMIYPFKKNLLNVKSNRKLYLSKLGIILLQSILQGCITVFTMTKFLGFSPLYLKQTYLLAILTSFTFLSIISFLIVNYGWVGKLLTIVLLVLQLATSEGTYPLVLSNPIFKQISKYMPATYSIKGFRHTISIDDKIFKYCIILLIVSIVINILHILMIFLRKTKYFDRRNKISMKLKEQFGN